MGILYELHGGGTWGYTQYNNAASYDIPGPRFRAARCGLPTWQSHIADVNKILTNLCAIQL